MARLPARCTCPTRHCRRISVAAASCTSWRNPPASGLCSTAPSASAPRWRCRPPRRRASRLPATSTAAWMAGRRPEAGWRSDVRASRRGVGWVERQRNPSTAPMGFAGAQPILRTDWRAGAPARSLPGLLEIAQIRRWLVLVGGHQQAVRAQEIGLPPNIDMDVGLGANVLVPPDRLLGLGATVVLRDGPRARQRVIDDGDFVVQHVGIAFVEIDALLDDALIVPVQRSAADIVVAGAFEAAGLDQQRVVAAVAVLVDPLADRIAREHRVGIHVVGKVAPVGM